MADFEELLNTDASTVERPPPQPVGTWRYQVKKYERIQSPEKQTPGIQFTLICVGVGDDVDKEELEAYSLKVDWQKKEVANFDTTFWITDDALAMLREFLEKLGLDVTGRSFKNLLPDSVGCEILGLVRHKPSTKEGEEDRTFSNIVKYTIAA